VSGSRSRILPAFNNVLIAFDPIIVIAGEVLTLLTLVRVGCSDLAFAFSEIAKDCLLTAALLAGDHYIPLERFAVGYQHGGTLA